MSDILKKIQEGCDAYFLLVNEFKSKKELQTHIIQREQKAGNSNYKQMRGHIFSDYELMWHRKVGKTESETGSTKPHARS